MLRERDVSKGEELWGESSGHMRTRNCRKFASVDAGIALTCPSEAMKFPGGFQGLGGRVQHLCPGTLALL